ncbi:MAG: S8 family serine peptidase [Euryarchaeota archaeon]|nr:S8 family serine peptidase [Euryarchaeota archaeon]
MRSVLLATLVVISMTLAGFWILTGDNGQAGPAGAVTNVEGRADGGRMILQIESVQLGAVSYEDGVEATLWSTLENSEEADLDPGPKEMATKRLTVGDLTELRIQFDTASLVMKGALMELAIPQNTLRLTVPGAPGQPGDTLHLTFDVGESVQNNDGLYTFRPFVSEAYWVRGEADPEEAWSLKEGAAPGEDKDGDGSGDESVDLSKPEEDPVPPQQRLSREPVGPPGGGTDGGLNDQDDQENNGNDQGPLQPTEDPARVNLYVRDATAPTVDSLIVTINKAAVQYTDGTIHGVFEGARSPDLAKLRGPTDWELIAPFQFDGPRDIAQLHIEFAREGKATINGVPQDVYVPQPILVLERPFSIKAGESFDLLVDFSLEESLVPTTAEWEFRPVAGQYQLSDRDTDRDGTADPMDADDDNDTVPDNEDPDRDGDKVPDQKPAQYRAGGPALPSVGRSNNKAIADATNDEFNVTRIQGDLEDRAGNSQTRPPGSDGSLPTVDPTQTSVSMGTSAPALPEPIREAMKDQNKRVEVVVTLLSQHFKPTEKQLDALQADLKSELKAAGVPVLLIEAPAKSLPSLLAMPGVLSATLNEELTLELDVAREVTTAGPVTSGSDPVRAPDGSILDGRGVGIAVIDTGIDATHPDLEYGTKVVKNYKIFYDRFEEMANSDSTSGHGTHVAGVVAGLGDMRPEYQGIAPGASVYGLGAGDGNTVFWSLQSLDWVVQNHAKVSPPIKVVVNAWSGFGHQHDPLSPVSVYVDKLVDQGVTVVFAAGNHGGDGTSDRTSAESSDPREGVISVGAYDDQGRATRDGTIADFSSRGAKATPSSWPDLVAPGKKITSALALTGAAATEGVLYESSSTAYSTLSGTSMAAPAVAGAVAILLQYDPSLTPAQIEQILERSAYPFDGETRGYDHPLDDPRYEGSTYDRGHGLLDVKAAVGYLAGN